MARNYQTTNPQFIENFVYTPPYELMLQVASKKQAEYNKAISTAKILGTVEIDHLNGEYDTANVQEKKRYYNDRANSIVEAIKKDPMNTDAYIGEIDKLQKELKTDFSTGDISKFIGSKTAYTKWEEENKKRLEDDPARYQAIKNGLLSRWGGDSTDSMWRGEAVTKDVEWNKLFDSVEKLKASEWSETTSGTGGGYIYKNKSTGEEVSKERINGHLLSRLLTPENMAALRQSEQFGIAKYFDENGNLDPDSPGLASVRGTALTSAYSKGSKEQTVSSDATWNNKFSQSQANQRQANAQRHEFAKMSFADQIAQAKEERALGYKSNDRIYNLQLDIAEETDPQIKSQKQGLLDSMTSAQFLVDLPKNIKYTSAKEASKAAGKGDQDAYNLSWKSIDYARKNMNLNPVEEELMKRIDGGLYGGNVEKIITGYIEEKGLNQNSKTYDNSINRANNKTKQHIRDRVNQYISKRDEYITKHSNTAGSAHVGETLNPTGKTAATKLYNNYKDGFIALDAKTKQKLPIGPNDVQISGALSGNSYGSVALTGKYIHQDKKGSEQRDIILVPSQNNPVLVQATRGIAISSTDPKGTIYNDLVNWRVGELKETEANAKQAMKNSNEFVYKTHDSKGSFKSYNINYSNGGYNIVNNQGVVLAKARSMDEVAEIINTNTNTK